MEFFNTIDQAGQAEYKDRGSKFLAHAFPLTSVLEFKSNLLTLKKEHPKAAHHCFAYRLGLEKNNFRVGDDGEPAGTAGKPILGQIDSKEVTDTLIVVVRYFGGTLLGVPGLINAYKMAASLVLQVVPIVQKPVMISYTIQFDYTQMNEIMIILKQLQSIIISQENQLFSMIKVDVPKNRKEELLYRIGNLRNVEIIAGL
ncbi:MAG: YigZ family protein [Gloeobacteraceae cyanobacterium ES-bin-316]|nr:YigZ family protein [Ferruginibacter sp.]